MKKLYFALALPALLSACASTVDVERAVRLAAGIGKQEDPSSAVVAVPIEVDPPPAIVIERPVFIPEGPPAPGPLQGRGAVEAAVGAVVRPSDFSHSAMLYDYDRDFVYELYCQPFRLSDVTLQPGEVIVEAPFVSDSERWMLGAGVSYEGGEPVQHIYVKPTVSGLAATLIINTEMRVYHLILRSYSDIHMPVVRWRYHDRDMPQVYARRPDAGAAPPAAAEAPAQPAQAKDDPAYLADPRFLSFDYRITYGVFRKPRWLPTMAYDDGRKTYVAFPDLVLTMEMPAVFEDRDSVVNYRVNQNVMIIDKLIEKITIRLGDRIATVEKKKGR